MSILFRFQGDTGEHGPVGYPGIPVRSELLKSSESKI